jgi:arginine decarboxylase
MSDLEIPDVSRSPRLHAYTSVWRLRGDAWASLADVTKRLSDDRTPDELRPALQEEARELVRLLDPLETYWAYPGRSRLEQIALLCDIEDYESAMRKADTVTRVISGNIEEAITAEAGVSGTGRGQPAGG